MELKKLIKLLKANKLQIILFFFVFCIAGCDFFSDLFTESYDPREHPVIMEGDTLVFIGTENIDSFYVWESKFYKSGERYGDEDYEQYRGRMYLINYVDTFVRLDIIIINSSYSTHNYLPFRSDSDPYISAGPIEKRNDGFSAKIGSVVLTDLYKVDFRKNLNQVDSKLFIEIDIAYYSKTYGFVKYIKYTGEEFVLSEESLEMLMARE